MLKLDSKAAKAKKESAERIPIFSIDDVEYAIPKVIDGAAIIRYLDTAAEESQEAAIAGLLRELVGDEGYEALIAFEGLEPGQLKQLFDDVETYAFAQIESSGLGKSRRRRSKR